MVRVLSYLFLFSLIFTIGFSPQNADAQIGEWIFDTTINPGSTPLEISAGGVFPDTDTFIVLDQTNLSELQVYNINRNTRTVDSSSTIPVNTPAFGLGHVIREANNTAHSCFVDNFQLYATHSQNGTAWDKVLVTNQFSEFSSCDTAVDNGNIYIGACNFGQFAYGIYESTDNGETWNLIRVINNVRCAFSGGTRANFNIIDGEQVVFYMTGFQNGADTVTSDFQELAASNLLATTRLETDDELIIDEDGEKEVVDEDNQGPPLAESFPSKKVTIPSCPDCDVKVAPYYHRESGTIRLAVVDDVIGSSVVVLGPAPPFSLFFGLACFEGPEGIVNVIAPGRHFQYNADTEEVVEVPEPPFAENTDGPMGAITYFTSGGEIFGSAAWQNTFDFGQFGLKRSEVPTLSEWGLITLGVIFMVIGVIYLRRRKVKA